MISHPENLPRSPGSYDPGEPLIVPHGDVIAARNALVNLLKLLPDLTAEQLFDLQVSLAYKVRPGLDVQQSTLKDRGLVSDWLVELRDRLTGYLPSLH